MARRQGPEDFYEVFREVQDSKKAPADEEATEGVAAVEDEPAVAAAGLTVTWPVVAAFVVGALLLVVMGYLVGKQRGYALAQRPKQARSQGAAPDTAKAAPAPSDEPELVDGKIFTLLVSGSGELHRQSAQEEADYLNRYEPFKALRVQAYVWRDARRRYRVCVRGLAAMSAEERERVRDEIRRLESRFGSREYRDADFFPR